MVTALTGKFVDGEMLEGSHVKIVRERCRRGIKHLRWTRPKEGDQVFRFQRATNRRCFSCRE